MFEEAFQQGRHVAEPEREEEHQVLAPGDVLLRLAQALGQGFLFPGLLAAQQRKLEAGDIDGAHFMSAFPRAVPIGIGERVTQVRSMDVGVTLDQEYPAHVGDGGSLAVGSI